MFHLLLGGILFLYYELEIPDKTLCLFLVVMDVFANSVWGRDDKKPNFSDGDNSFSRNVMSILR